MSNELVAFRRPTPPTVVDVTVWAWWWNFPANGNPPHVMQLDVDPSNDRIFRADSEDGGLFDPADWPGDWAPCLPPK